MLEQALREKFKGKSVVIVLPTLELGGAELQAFMLACYLKSDLNCKVVIVGLDSAGSLSECCRQNCIPVRVIPFKVGKNPVRLLACLLRLTGQLRREKVDILLPYTTYPNGLCGLIWRFTGAKICIWNQRDSGIERFGATFEPLAVGNTPMFVANSEQGREFLISTLKVEAERIHVVPNGVKTKVAQASRCQWRQKIGVADNALIVCMVANLTRYKDHRTLLEAWKQVLNMRSAGSAELVLVLAGRFGDSYPSLSVQAEILGIAESVRFLGKITDIAGLLSASDLGVLSTPREGMPNAILEYMVYGLPFVASDLPEIRALVDVSMHAFLAAPGKAEQFADRIGFLLDNKALRDRFGMVNAKKSLEYSERKMCITMAEIMLKAL